MRFLVDANAPHSAVALLRRLGHQADHVQALGLGAAIDERVALQATIFGAILLSRDLDFADIRRYPPEKSAGIVVMRLPDDSTANTINAVLERFITGSGIVHRIPGHLVILEVAQFRVRPPLD